MIFEYNQLSLRSLKQHVIPIEFHNKFHTRLLENFKERYLPIKIDENTDYIDCHQGHLDESILEIIYDIEFKYKKYNLTRIQFLSDAEELLHGQKLPKTTNIEFANTLFPYIVSFYHLLFFQLNLSSKIDTDFRKVNLPYWDFIFISSRNLFCVAGIVDVMSNFYQARKSSIILCNNLITDINQIYLEKLNAIFENGVILQIINSEKKVIEVFNFFRSNFEHDAVLRSGLNSNSKSLIFE